MIPADKAELLDAVISPERVLVGFFARTRHLSYFTIISGLSERMSGGKMKRLIYLLGAKMAEY